MKLVLFAVASLLVGPIAFAAEGEGLTRPVKLPAHDAAQPPCTAPTGLQKRLVFVQDNEREFMQGVGRGLEAAARARGLAYRVAFADNDPERMIEQVGEIAADRTGAIVVAPIDPLSLAPGLQEVIRGGAYVGAVVPPPATSVLNAPQYLTGEVLAESAANYIRTRLGGKAKVVLLTHDGLQFLAPRFTAMRDTLRTLPGVTIVADISPATVDKDGGYRTMKMILLAQPSIDVVLGADTVVLGALAALREAGVTLPAAVPESLVIIFLGSLATIFVLVRLISIPDEFLPADGRGIGIYISLASALAVIVAGLLEAAEEL